MGGAIALFGRPAAHTPPPSAPPPRPLRPRSDSPADTDKRAPGTAPRSATPGPGAGARRPEPGRTARDPGAQPGAGVRERSHCIGAGPWELLPRNGAEGGALGPCGAWPCYPGECQGLNLEPDLRGGKSHRTGAGPWVLLPRNGAEGGALGPCGAWPRYPGECQGPKLEPDTRGGKSHRTGAGPGAQPSRDKERSRTVRMAETRFRFQGTGSAPPEPKGAAQLPRNGASWQLPGITGPRGAIPRIRGRGRRSGGCEGEPSRGLPWTTPRPRPGGLRRQSPATGSGAGERSPAVPGTGGLGRDPGPKRSPAGLGRGPGLWCRGGRVAP
jgi:hypothetical protein